MRYVGMAVFMIFMACNKNEPATPTAIATPNPAPTKLPAVTPPPTTSNPTPIATPGAFKDFPAANISGLSPENKSVFAAIANEEICPCNCPKTLGACLQDTTQCPAAVIYGNWVANRLKEGVPQELLRDAITKELTSGFTAKPVETPAVSSLIRGNLQATHTVVEYADFQCPHCKLASEELKNFVKTKNNVKVIFKHYPLSAHPVAFHAAVAVEAAVKQNKGWEMHDAVFNNQESLSEQKIQTLAQLLSLDMTKFKKDLADPATAEKVKQQRAEGDALGLEGTPYFVVNGRPYFGARNSEGFALRLAMEEARNQGTCGQAVSSKP